MNDEVKRAVAIALVKLSVVDRPFELLPADVQRLWLEDADAVMEAAGINQMRSARLDAAETHRNAGEVGVIHKVIDGRSWFTLETPEHDLIDYVGLQADLDELETTDPAVAKAAECLDAATLNVLNGGQATQLARLVKDTIRARYMSDDGPDNCAFVMDDDPLNDVVIDGHVDLLEVAEVIIAAGWVSPAEHDRLRNTPCIECGHS